MEYGVSVDVRVPHGAPDLDPLQCEGAASLLTTVLDQVGGGGDDGAEVFLDRHWVGTHPQGALVLLVLGAASLDVAEHAAHDIMLEVLEDTELLADWQVAACQVGFDERFVGAGLNAADGPDAPPGDVAERARWHTEHGDATGGDAGGDVDWRAWVLDHASQLRAFDPDVFDTATGREQARLAAGALVFAGGTVIDELFQDLETLTDEGGTPAGSGPYMVLDSLPRQFASSYDVRFVHRFLVAAVTVTARLTQPDWSTPGWVAEALALHLVLDAARSLLAQHDLVDDDVLTDLYNGFDDAAYDDLDHEWRYSPALDGFENDPEFQTRLGVANMRVDTWFDPLPHASSQVHAYLLDSPPPRLDDRPG